MHRLRVEIHETYQEILFQHAAMTIPEIKSNYSALEASDFAAAANRRDRDLKPTAWDHRTSR